MLSRLYYLTTGVYANQVREAHADFAGAISALGALAQREGQNARRTDWSEAFEDLSKEKDTKDLAELFTRYGSDKATRHNYYLVYAALLKGKRHRPLSIFEIGLGTNHTDTPSNMGAAGVPGASLRAFRDWAPASDVRGADIDRRVLFSENRITTYFVDQTKPETFAALARELATARFDLIIDDGLHIPQANLNTLNFALPLLKPEGVFVVEDILDRYLSFWHIALALLEKKYDCRLVKTRVETMCIIRHRLP